MKVKILITGLILAIGFMAALAVSINEKESERVQLATSPSSNGIKNKSQSEEWEQYYPRQYSSWKRIKEGSVITDVLEQKPFYAVALAGYSFFKELNTPRGHFYAAQDQIDSLKIAGVEDKVSALCWTCHSGSVPELIKRDGEMEYYSHKWVDYGSQALNPIGCNNCHDDKTMKLDVKLPHLDRGLKVAGMKTFENSTHQEKRSLVCMQCHTEFYVTKEGFKDKNGNEKTANLIQLPYAKGTKAKEILDFYNDKNLTKYTNPISKTPMIKAVHTYFENYQNGTHAKQGVSCSDCHMPYTRDGVVKYTDHQIQSPLNTVTTSCLNCHKESESKLLSTIKEKKDRYTLAADTAFENFAKAHIEIGEALKAGASDEELSEIRKIVRDGQFIADMCLADHGSYFHSSEDVLGLLGEANNMAQDARLKLSKVLVAHGITEVAMPEYDTKEKAQKLGGVDFAKIVQAKKNFKDTVEAQWRKEAKEKGYIAPNSVVLDPVFEKKPSYYKAINE